MASIGIIGAGSIGLFVGAKLLDAGHSVHLLSRGNFKALQDDGFIVDEKHYFSTHVYDDLLNMPSQDYVFLCTTVSDNESYLKKLHHIFKPNTLVISLQNGINFEEPIFKAIQPNKLLNGTCWIKVSKLNPTQIRHDFGLKIVLGEYPACATNSIVSSEFDAFKTFMNSAGFELELVDHYLSPQLTKLAINLPFFGLMLRHQIKQAKVFLEHLEELLELQIEINSIGNELGLSIDDAYVKKINAQLKQLPEENLNFEEKKRLFKEVKPNFESFFAFLDSQNVIYPKLLLLYNELKQ